MVGEVFAGASALKNAFDLAKALRDINDATRLNAAVIDLQEQILSAQQAHTTLFQRVSELEKEVATFEKWDATKQQYDLKKIGWCAYAYMLKPNARFSAPPHWVCTKCFGDRYVEIMQTSDMASGHKVRCPRWRSTIAPDVVSPEWCD